MKEILSSPWYITSLLLGLVQFSGAERSACCFSVVWTWGFVGLGYWRACLAQNIEGTVGQVNFNPSSFQCWFSWHFRVKWGERRSHNLTLMKFDHPGVNEGDMQSNLLHISITWSLYAKHEPILLLNSRENTECTIISFQICGRTISPVKLKQHVSDKMPPIIIWPLTMCCT